MSTSSQANSAYALDDIVISGISARLPMSGNMEEFKENLMNGVNMVTEDEKRWPIGLFDLPMRSGKLDNIDRFDAQFFGVHAKLANVMDPQLRMLLELTFEAIVDSGAHPQDIRGSNTGVFTGISTNEAIEYWTNDPDKNNGYPVTGGCQSMMANWISYTYDLRGPSYVVDSACSSSAQALYQAFYHMKMGECDSAIVAGVNMNFKPEYSLSFAKLNLLARDGYCKTFDSRADGYTRSEGAVVLFLQKKSSALRIYCNVLNVKTNNDGAKEQGITYPSGVRQKELASTLFADVGIDPNKIAYVEAHGTGTKAGDREEINALVELFCSKRKEPLLMGSVKTNLGHTEAAAGLCSIAKIIISMESGRLPPNLHFKIPNPDIAGLCDGRIKVITEVTPWAGGLVALNSFGFGGSNVHVLLESNAKVDKISNCDATIPRLVTVSGRTAESVEHILNYIKNNQPDPEFLALVDNVFKKKIKGHNYRGYTMLDVDGEKEIKEISSQVRPVWFLFSGQGSQWPQMARDMMKIPVFRNSVKKSAEILHQFDIHLIDVIVNSTQNYLQNKIEAFVSLAAIQIALTDVLHSIGVRANGFIGHSAGELCCAYADGCLTAEQVILMAYWRGRCVQDTKLINGKMAAVNLSKAEFEAKKPVGIYVACHNSATNLTFSGPADKMDKFITKLKKDNIFVKEVQTDGVAYHSKYIELAAPLLLYKLKELITKPNKRTSAWISSSILEENWEKESSQLCSAEYFVSNFVSCVNFHNASKHIPENAILIEVAPYGMMQAIVKRSLSKNITNIDLMNYDCKNNVKYFLKNIGRLHNSGAQPQISKLYKPVSFPVSRGTAMLAPLIKWDHRSSWDYPIYNGAGSSFGHHLYEIDVSQPEHKFLVGHTVNGTIVFPTAGYLMLAWRSLAKLHNQSIELTSVMFEDLEFINVINIPKQGKVKFSVDHLTGTGRFNITSGDTLAVTGIIQICHDPDKQISEYNVCSNSPLLEAEDIYKELRLRGCEFNGTFRSIINAYQDLSKITVIWHNNWIAFMDGMMQACVISETSRSPSIVARIQKIIIDPQRLLKLVKLLPEHNHIGVKFDSKLNIIKSEGVEIRGIETIPMARKVKPQRPIVEKYIFIPFENMVHSSKEEALNATLYIVIENTHLWDLTIVEVSCGLPEKYFITEVKNIFETEPKIRVKCLVAAAQYSAVYSDGLHKLQDSSIEVTSEDIRSGPLEIKCHLVIAKNVLITNHLTILSNMIQSLDEGGFILLHEDSILIDNKLMIDLQNIGLQISSHIKTENQSYLLLRKIFHVLNDYVVLKVTNNDVKWVENVKQALSENKCTNSRVYIVSEKERCSGVMGFVNCLRLEPSGQKVRLFFIQDEDMEPFNVHSDTYQSQIQKDLAFNVCKMNQWGSYRHIPITYNSVQIEHVYAEILKKGDLSSLSWTESPINILNPSSAQTCTTYYSTLNFKDMLVVIGHLNLKCYESERNQEEGLGMEYSGIRGNGERVMGIVPKQAIATTIMPDDTFTWPVPDKWTLEEAATIPVVYATTYYGLLMRGCLQPGESILIHSGADDIGIAAISVALHMGCNVFTTVETPDEQTFLKNFFPQLSVNHIGYSQDMHLAQLIMQQTNGRGVNVILNISSNNELQGSLQCLADLGRYVQVGKVDILKNVKLGMKLFLNDATLHRIDLDILMTGSTEIKSNVARLLSEGIVNGAVRPLPVARLCNDDQLEQAFRFMTAGKHFGKVLIKFRNEERNQMLQPSAKLVNAIPQLHLHANKSYIIVGGLGGIGIEMCNLFVTRGAKHLIISSIKGISTGYQRLHISRWQSLGVTVIVSTANIATMNGTQELLQTALKINPIGGIFNLAVTLRDALFENQSEANFEIVLKPKLHGTKHLDIVSRELAPELDHFVVFSSMTCGRGNAGQTNYGFANSVMERICEVRHEEGLPGLAIQWGPISDVGLINPLLADASIRGLVPQSLPSCLNMLSMLLSSPHPVVSSIVFAEKLTCVTSRHKWEQSIMNILGLKDSNTINGTTSLSDLGIDSLMNAEIKQYLEGEYNLTLSTAEVRELTFDKLKQIAKQ